jgi:alpha-galactosidase/6-phospho-beta-glucosidase family protein
MAEYVPYFIRRFADLKVHSQEQPHLNRSMGGWTGPIIQPSTGTGGQVETKIPKAWDIQLYEGLHKVTYQQELDRFQSGENPPLRFSEEYAAHILSSMISGQPHRMSLNVPNHGLINNLTKGCTVEVPTCVDDQGLHPEGIGALPSQCAALCQRNVDVQALTVQALEEEKPEHLFHALLLDPLTGACLEPQQIQNMFVDIIKALGTMLPNWLRESVT